MARKIIEWYKPSIGIPDWDIKEMSRDQRNLLKNRIVMGTVHTEEEYQLVIGYLYKKYPHLMDITGNVTNPFNGEITNNTSIQWNYSPYKNKVNVFNEKDEIANISTMYAFIYYDRERDFEPVAFAGSYFKQATIDLSNLCMIHELKEIKEKLNIEKVNNLRSAIGEGYVMFVDPYYRRLGLGNYSWTAEAALYRDIASSSATLNNLADDDYSDIVPMVIPMQMEIQNEYSVKSTISCFEPSDKYPCVDEKDQLLFGEHSKHLYITSNGRVKNDGSRCQIRLIMNYNDENLINNFNSMQSNMKEIYNKPHWEFLNREAKNNNLSVKEYKDELLKPWKR